MTPAGEDEARSGLRRALAASPVSRRAQGPYQGRVRGWKEQQQHTTREAAAVEQRRLQEQVVLATKQHMVPYKSLAQQRMQADIALGLIKVEEPLTSSLPTSNTARLARTDAQAKLDNWDVWPVDRLSFEEVTYRSKTVPVATAPKRTAKVVDSVHSDGLFSTHVGYLQPAHFPSTLAHDQPRGRKYSSMLSGFETFPDTAGYELRGSIPHVTPFWRRQMKDSHVLSRRQLKDIQGGHSPLEAPFTAEHAGATEVELVVEAVGGVVNRSRLFLAVSPSPQSPGPGAAAAPGTGGPAAASGTAETDSATTGSSSADGASTDRLFELQRSLLRWVLPIAAILISLLAFLVLLQVRKNNVQRMSITPDDEMERNASSVCPFPLFPFLPSGRALFLGLLWHLHSKCAG